jgi:hypothetical protein
MDQVRRHVRQRAAAELRRYASLLRYARSVVAAAFTLATVVAAQEPVCNPCVDGPEMFEHRRNQPLADQPPSNPRAYAPELFQKCPADLQPTVQPSPEFPAYGNWQLSVTVRYFVDIEGRVLVPSVWDAKWTLEGEVGKLPASFENALIEAVSKWRFPARSRPCAGSISRTFSHAF